MTRQPPKPKVGILGLTLEFYEQRGPATREGREEFVREQLLPLLSEVADVTFDGAVFRREDIEARVAEFERDGVDVLLVLCLTYSTSLSSLPALQQTRLPIVIWNTQELYSVDESYSGADLSANHGVHGTFDLCNVLVRSGLRFGYVTSHINDTDCKEKVADVLQAASAVTRLKNTRLGLIGYPFPGMGDFGLDTTHLAGTLGCAWDAISVAEFNKRADEADPKSADGLVADYRSRYDIAEDITDEDLKVTAAAELALRGIVDDYRLDAYSYQFLSFGQDDRTKTLPFVAASRLLEEGVGFGGEGDLIAAAYSTILNWLSPPASFSEIFTTDFAGNSVLLSHMGEANAAMHRKDAKLRMVKRPTSLVPVQASQLALAVSYEPCPATLTALTLVDDGIWRIIASQAELIDFGPLEHLYVPHAKAAPSGDVRDFLTAYATSGGPHHMAVCFGDATSRLANFAMLLGADYVEV